MPIAPIANGINYITKGNPENPPLLLVPGLGAGTSSWMMMLPTYNLGNPKPLYLIAYDPRGLYKSGDVPDYGFEEMVQDARDLLAYLNIPKAHIMGWSLGGILAQTYAYTYPDAVDKLILLATAPVSPTAPELAEYNRILRERFSMPAEPTPADYKAMMAAIAGLSFNSKLLTWLLGRATGLASLPETTFRQGVARQLRALASLDSYPRLGEISAPTLVAHASDDRIMPLLGADLIYAKLTCPKTKVIIPGASHACAIENFFKVNRVIRGFLK